uniref:MADF domain-containing protein n=1 Tax=Acrobeloides nanus TaxID=290746 RepID=A0A914CRE3_9BILA
MVSFSDDDINTLIDEVQSHNLIWNFQNDDHPKRKEVDKAFEEIAKKMSDEKRTIAVDQVWSEGEISLKSSDTQPEIFEFNEIVPSEEIESSYEVVVVDREISPSISDLGKNYTREMPASTPTTSKMSLSTSSTSKIWQGSTKSIPKKRKKDVDDEFEKAVLKTLQEKDQGSLLGEAVAEVYHRFQKLGLGANNLIFKKCIKRRLTRPKNSF